MRKEVDDIKIDCLPERKEINMHGNNTKAIPESLTHLTISNHDKRLLPSNPMIKLVTPKTEITEGSVGGICGGSEGESDEISLGLDDNLVFQKETIEISVDLLKSSHKGGMSTGFIPLIRDDSFHARRGSDDDTTRCTGIEDDIPLTPKMLEPRRQSSYRNIRSVSLHSQASRRGSDESSEEGVGFWNDIAAENVEPARFLSRPPLPKQVSINRRKDEKLHIISSKISTVMQIATKKIIGVDGNGEELKILPTEQIFEKQMSVKNRNNGRPEVLTSPEMIETKKTAKKNEIPEESQTLLTFKSITKQPNAEKQSVDDAEKPGSTQLVTKPETAETKTEQTSDVFLSVATPKRQEPLHKSNAEYENLTCLRPANILSVENNTVENSQMPLHLKQNDSEITLQISHAGNAVALVKSDSSHGILADELKRTNPDDYLNSDLILSSETRCAPSFSQFGLLQIQPEQLLLIGNEYLFSDDGPAHIDCFLLNHDVGFSDHFAVDARKPLDSASVGSLCFPEGLRVRYIPRAGLRGARRMGLVGSKGDTCHVIVFTNARGKTEHGVAITIQWEINLKKQERQGLSEIVHKRRKRRRSARKIQKCWRRCVQNRVLLEALNISGFKGLPPAELKAELTSGELNLLERALKNKDEHNFLLKQSTNKSPTGNGVCKQTKKRGFNKKFSKMLNRSKQNELKADTSEIEAVTRAAVMRSPCICNSLSNSTSNGDSRDSSLQTEETDYFFTPKTKPSSRKSFSSVRSVFQTRSTTAILSTISVPTVDRPMRLRRRQNLRFEALAREAYETMKENDRAGSICVVQKCYTLIGCQPDEHVLLLGPLQQLINSERKEILLFRRSRAEKSQKKRAKSTTTVDEERRLDWELKTRRRAIMRVMHEKLRLTTRQALVTHPRNQLESLKGRWHYFETTVYEIPSCEFIRLPLPLPRIGREWALSQFLLDIGPDSLVLCLKLMLLERSILVLGDNLSCVSTTACALIELLKPFEWASTFMPVLPPRMLDFINSPVPFIAGVSVRDVYAVEKDRRVLEAMSHGMSLLNLKTKTVHITAEKDVSKMISLDPYLLEKLKFLRCRLQSYLRENPLSALRNFNVFLKSGFSPQESLTLHSVTQAIEQHFSHFCGDLTKNGKAWKRYGTIDMNSNEFIYNPKWFLNPMETDQAFQEAMAHTQLFSSFVHEKRQDQMEIQEMMEGELGHYIANWIYGKWKQRRAQYRFDI